MLDLIAQVAPVSTEGIQAVNIPSVAIPGELLTALQTSEPETLVVGIGSAHGEDQLGWLIADLVADLQMPNVTVRRAVIPLDVLDWIDQYATVHLVDAMQCQPDVDVVQRWDWPRCEGIQECYKGTHGYDLIAVLRLATALGLATANIAIWGVKLSNRPFSKHRQGRDMHT